MIKGLPIAKRPRRSLNSLFVGVLQAARQHHTNAIKQVAGTVSDRFSPRRVLKSSYFGHTRVS